MIGGSWAKILGSRASSCSFGVKIWSSEAKIWCSRPNIGGSGAKSQNSGAMIGVFGP